MELNKATAFGFYMFLSICLAGWNQIAMFSKTPK